jgi:hypothetical protein
MAHTDKGKKRQEKLERRLKRAQLVVEVLAKHNAKKVKKKRTVCSRKCNNCKEFLC